MKATMKLTFEGLARALRTRLHQMAEEIETGYRRAGEPAVRARAGVEKNRIDDDEIGSH